MVYSRKQNISANYMLLIQDEAVYKYIQPQKRDQWRITNIATIMCKKMIDITQTLPRRFHVVEVKSLCEKGFIQENKYKTETSVKRGKFKATLLGMVLS